MARRLTQEMRTSTCRKALAWGGPGALPCKPLRWKHRQSQNPKPRASPVSLVTPQLHCSPLARARPPVSPLLHGVAKRGSVQLEEIDPKEIQHVRCLPPQWVSVKHLAWASVCVCVCSCVMYARAHAQNTMTCCLLCSCFNWQLFPKVE